jgi:hypothetical protein
MKPVIAGFVSPDEALRTTLAAGESQHAANMPMPMIQAFPFISASVRLDEITHGSRGESRERRRRRSAKTTIRAKLADLVLHDRFSTFRADGTVSLTT